MIFTVFSCRISHDTQILWKHKRCIREVKIILFCRMAYKACAPRVDLNPRGHGQNFDSFVLHVQKLNLFVKFCTFQNALNTNMLFYKCQKNKPWKIGTAKLKQTKSPNCKHFFTSKYHIPMQQPCTEKCLLRYRYLRDKIVAQEIFCNFCLNFWLFGTPGILSTWFTLL